MGLVHNPHHHRAAHEIEVILAQYVPPYILSFLEEEGMKIIPLPDGVTYARASDAVRRTCGGVDSWPVPPAGLFVVEERTVYVRAVTSLTVIHELGHALDCALGKNQYLSRSDPMIRDAFANARTFVTPYAASGVDEFFAENFRAYLGANDPGTPWPTVTRARLQASAPTMATFFGATFADLERRYARDVTLAPQLPREPDVVAERVQREFPSRGRGR